MTIIQAIILAIVEGLTEFLPVSSTAHMKFTNPIIGVASTPFSDMFEIVIQLAAILAVVVVYYKKFFDFSRLAFYIKLIVAVIPAVIFGALLLPRIAPKRQRRSFRAGLSSFHGWHAKSP